MADGPALTHEAEQRLRSDIRRDAAQAEKQADDADAHHRRRDAMAAEAQTDVTRHLDAN